MAWTAEQRREYLQSRGFIAPDNDGFLGELKDSAAQSFISAARGVGATINELTGNSSMQDYFQGVLDRNQQWNAPEDGSVGSYIGRAVGSAAGSTAATLTAATAGTLLGVPGAGVAAGVTTAFAQSFGDNVQRNREAGYSDDKALGMAFLESGIDAAIENLPFGIVGKSGKVIAQAGRLRNISAAGKRELLNAVGKRVAAATGQKETQSTLARLGKAAFMNGLGEGGEEGLQTLNSYLNQTLGGDTRANITVEELADSIAQGFIGGFFLGGVQSTPLAFTRTSGGNAGESQLDTATPAPPLAAAEGTVIDVTPLEDMPQATVPENNPLFEQLVANAGKYLGIKVDYMDSLPNGEKNADENNGMYDSKNKTLYLNRQSATVNPVKTLGHELKHYLDDNYPELAKTFDELVKSGLTELGQNFNTNIHKGDMAETASDIFADIFARPDTWSKVAVALDEKTPGMGEAFLKVLQDFIAHIKDVLKGNVQDPQAEQLLNNFERAESEAVRMLSELRRRNGNASQVENVVGAKGNTAVETVPVADINVDAERFQFKSNTNKSSGVNESNKLGGDWDPRTAGNLYLWQDKSGKMYVVNGHHRLELARRNNVENLNAIIDRETDGVTAEQARRNGVLINIRDGQGDVRDYAAFVRSEKLSEDEAKSQGITARQKGRAGFALGKSGDTLYEAYRNEEIPESKAVIIAEVAQGNEAIEYAGIRLAVDRKLSGEALRQTLKLAAQNSSGKKNTAAQDSLFDMVDDTVLKEWELIGKAAATHIKEIRTRIEAAKDAIKNPEAAKSLGVKTTKGAEKLLAQAQEELARWENYATNPELMAQLRQEANIAPQEDVSKTENTTIPEVKEEVVSAENAQTIAPEDNADGLFDTQEETVSKKESVEPVVKENLTTETTATPKENLAVASDGSDGREVTEVAPEKDPTVDDFLLRFAPQMDAIIAKNNIKARGNLYDDDLKSIAMTAATKAYEDFEPGKGASLDTWASVAVKNAIIDFNRKQHREFERSGGNVSLQTENDQGNTLEDTVASDAESSYYDEVSARENPESAKRRILESKKLSPLQKKIVDLLNQGYPRSVVIRKLGMQFGEEGHEYMSPEEFQRRLKNIRAIIAQEGVRYSRKREQNIEDVNQKFNEDIDRQITGTLPKGYIHQLGMPGDILLSTGVPDLPIELSSSHLDKKSKQENHPFDIADLKNLPKMLQNPIAVFLYGDKDQAQNIIIEVQRDGKNFLVGLSFNFEHDGLVVNSIRGLFAKETVFWLRWIEQGKTLYIDKEKVQKLIAQQQTNFADVDNLDLNSINNIIQNFKNPSPDLEFSRKRLHQQINPVVVEGKVRDEYADLLSERKYSVQTLEVLQNKALEWIKRKGGVVPALESLLKDNAPGDPAVAEIARRILLNSEVFAENISRSDRTKLYELEIDARSEWGRTGRVMQLAAMQIKDIASVQAILNKLHKNMPPEDVQKLRNQIKDEMGIDIFELPENIVNDKSKLDKILRAELAHKASWRDKFYEYWVNGLLSGPTTHISNLLGNTANAAYELGIKRFTEALVNIAAGRKDGATFGEFRQMAKAFNWSNAWQAAKKSFDLEVLDPAGKFLENNTVAIGGKTGRFIRIPGRALKAADAFAKALIEPVETAAYAYRMGVQQGISDRELAVYIQKQLADSDSDAYQWGKQRSRELTFQENPGDVVNRLMALRESGGAMGTALKIFLPFIKTPYNILRQGIRKGPVGTLNLAMEFGKVAMGKRKFDGEMVARIAEQLLAWGTFMVFYGLSDDDDLPILTGTSSAYGSAEYGFKANKIPPYSIRLGNTWYSYQRIEPLATGLAAIADGIQAIRNVRNGKDATRAMTETIGATLKVIGEKSFLDSIGEIIKVVEDPERNAMRPATNLIASAMPALIRQSRQAFIEEVGESKSRNMGAEWWKDQFDLIINRAGITTAIPKVDYFGRDVKKDDWSTSMLSDAGRILPIKRVEADRNMDSAERLIWNYNQRNPNEEYYPGIPRNTFTHNGVKMYFAGDDYREFAVQSGQLAHKQINNAIRAGRLNVENPTEKDIKLIRKIFTRARKETQDKLLQQKRGNQL